MEEQKKYFIIGSGMSGSFGGIRHYQVIQVDTQEEADDWAFEDACEEYDRYSGMYGLREIGEIMVEDNVDEDEACEIFEEERERWITYIAVPFSKEFELKISSQGWQNDYKKFTDLLD